MRRDELKLCDGRAAALRLGLCLALLLWPAAARAQSVAFINPGKSDEIYWLTASQGMEAAAKSLSMNFEVRYAQREPLKTLEIARELAAGPAGKRPEYVVITDDYAVADQLLKIIEPAGMKTFLAYSSIPADQRGGTGSPRGKYKGWLGSLEPRAEDAGYLTARALIERGKKEKVVCTRRQASHAGDRRRSFHALVDQSQSGHAPRCR
jgi:ABC-type sugar transport system substrate-binding protein